MDMSKMKTGLYYTESSPQWNDFGIQGSWYLSDKLDWEDFQTQKGVTWETTDSDIKDNMLACPEEYLK